MNFLSQFSVLEWIGLVTGIVYVILAARNNIVCWYFGIISCACIAYHDFFGGMKLYSDGMLQILYIGMGILGLWQWRNKAVEDDVSTPENKTIWKDHLVYIFIASLISLLYGKMMGLWTDAFYPVVDAFTTVFSVLATILLVRRQVSAWVYFVFIDVVMAVIYFKRGFPLYSLLYVVFTVVAVYGVVYWKRRVLEARNTI